MSAGAPVAVAELAERLIAAEAERRTIPQLVRDHPDLDLETAYEIQRATFKQRLDRGDTALGYKIGLSSRASQRSMGAQEPVRAPLTAGMLHSQEAPLDLSTLVHPRVEAEIAFLLGDDVGGENATLPGVLRATAGVGPALDIVDSRYDGFKFTLADGIADSSSAARIVLGGEWVSPEHLDLELEGMALHADGEVIATAAGAAVGGHPAAVVAWLAGAVGGLQAGEVVLSGGLSPAVPLAGKRSVVAHYTNLGTVALRLGPQ